MTPAANDPATTRARTFKVTAWVFWAVFVLVCLGEAVFAHALQNDPYAMAYYGHHPKSRFTVWMTTDAFWMALLPLIWLVFVVLYQRKPNPKGILLVPLIGTMFLAPLIVFVLILCSGPPIQM